MPRYFEHDPVRVDWEQLGVLLDGARNFAVLVVDDTPEGNFELHSYHNDAASAFATAQVATTLGHVLPRIVANSRRGVARDGTQQPWFAAFLLLERTPRYEAWRARQ